MIRAALSSASAYDRSGGFDSGGLRGNTLNIVGLGDDTIPSPTHSQAAASGPSRERHYLIPSGVDGLREHLRLVPAHGDRRGVVLFVHGATLPSAVASDYHFGDSPSWLDTVAEQGYDVWALDFLGYATSDRYPQMQQPADATTPLGRSDVTEVQVTSAVDFIRRQERVPSIDIVAHSWGTVTAGRFAAKHPDEVRRLVLFAPINSRPVPNPSTPGAALPAWRYVDAAFQFGRFDAEVPGGQPQAFPKKVFDTFYQAYLKTDPTSNTRTPPSVQIPNGVYADIADLWAGQPLPYDPTKITAPTLVIRGEWDQVSSDTDDQALFAKLTSAPVKRYVVINQGTHVVHLEFHRLQLFREVNTFLAADDVLPRNDPEAHPPIKPKLPHDERQFGPGA